MSNPSQITDVTTTTEAQEDPQYRTRSGRVTRQAVRYEPDPDTVFLDDEGESDSEDCDESENEYSDDDSAQESEVEDEEMTDLDDDDMISDDSSNEDSGVESCDEEEDVLDWDNLTENASDRDLLETEDEFEDDVVGMSGDECESD